MPDHDNVFPRVIVVANEKGGTGKSTIAAHIAIALRRSGEEVATIDLDATQKTLTHFLQNRRVWSARVGRQLDMPTHVCLPPSDAVLHEATDHRALLDAIIGLSERAAYIVIDLPGHASPLSDAVHSMADTLITPINDSFLDLDLLASVDPETFTVSGKGRYAEKIEYARRQRRTVGKPEVDWVVLRNRLSTLSTSRNTRRIGLALADLRNSLSFRLVEGLAERVIFREFYSRGLTAVDDLDELTLGNRPTMSHVTAQLEIQSLVAAVMLGAQAQAMTEPGETRAVA